MGVIKQIFVPTSLRVKISSARSHTTTNITFVKFETLIVILKTSTVRTPPEILPEQISLKRYITVIIILVSQCGVETSIISPQLATTLELLLARKQTSRLI